MTNGNWWVWINHIWTFIVVAFFILMAWKFKIKSWGECFVCLFWGRVHNVAQAGLELTIPLPESSECWGHRHVPTCPGKGFWIFSQLKWHTFIVSHSRNVLILLWGKTPTTTANMSENPAIRRPLRKWQSALCCLWAKPPGRLRRGQTAWESGPYLPGPLFAWSEDCPATCQPSCLQGPCRIWNQLCPGRCPGLPSALSGAVLCPSALVPSAFPHRLQGTWGW